MPNVQRARPNAAWALALVALTLLSSAPAAAQQRPLVTEDPETIGDGRVLDRTSVV